MRRRQFVSLIGGAALVPFTTLPVYPDPPDGSGVPVARHVALREGDSVENPFGFPCFVKPARLGF